MIREKVEKQTNLFHQAFKKRESPTHSETIIKIACDYMINTNNYLQGNLQTLAFEETALLGKQIASFAEIINVLREIENGKRNLVNIIKASVLTLSIYEYYENTYSEEYESKDFKTQQEYIIYALMPLMLIHEYLTDFN